MPSRRPLRLATILERMEEARRKEIARLDSEDGGPPTSPIVDARRQEARASVATHWLTRHHDSGHPDWQVPAYAGTSHEGRFARRVIDIRSRGSAIRVERPADWLPHWAYQLFREARKRAALKGMEFSLSYADMLWLVWRSRGECEVSGIPFELDRRSAGERRPFAPSIDRISSQQGYVYANVRLVVTVANLAMNEWGEWPLIRLAQAVVRKTGTDPEKPR